MLARLVTWGTLVSLIVALFMVTLTLFLGGNLTALALTLISGMLIVLAVAMIAQILKRKF